MGETAVSLDACFEELVTDLQHATRDPKVAARLRHTALVAELQVEGHDHLTCALLFDGGAPEVHDGEAEQEPEVVLVLTPGLLQQFWDVPLAMAIQRGEATFTGPVRRLLTVMPVLRAAARDRRGIAPAAAA